MAARKAKGMTVRGGASGKPAASTSRPTNAGSTPKPKGAPPKSLMAVRKALENAGVTRIQADKVLRNLPSPTRSPRKRK